MNINSYRYEYLPTEKGLFNNFIDVAYILTLENSTRRLNYLDQIKKYNPHSKIIIQHNKGFKNCNKKLYKQNTVCDLNDAYYHVFLHAKKHNYKNIIIFEDDFFFDNININDINEIGQFINNNDYHIYNLGLGIGANIPYSIKHMKTLIGTCAHSVIYNHKYFDFYIEKYMKGFDAMCDNIWNDINIIKYTYYKAICFQTFPLTENIKNWPASKLAIFFINLVSLDKRHQPGFNIMYIINILPFIIILFTFIIYLTMENDNETSII